MKRINVYLTVVVMLLSLQSIAQKKDKEPDKSQFQRLYIGDTVPMEKIIFNNIRNYPGGKAKLSDFKGKYIILDFWSKYCSSCIAAFPPMEELQNQFKDKIQVLLVTHDTEDELAMLFKNSKNVKQTKLPMIVGEQILTKQLFPNESVPYHVWIDNEGKVVATTYESETIPKNVADFIADKPLNLLIKQDLTISKFVEREIEDEKKSFLKIGNGIFLGNIKYYGQLPKPKLINALPESPVKITDLPYYSLFMSRLLEYDASDSQVKNFVDEKSDQKKGLRGLNLQTEDYYRFAFNKENTRFLGELVLDGKARLLIENISDSTIAKRRYINNSYCYESSVPDYSFEKAKKILQQDLIRFFGMTANIEEREMKCAVIFRLGTPAEKNLWSKKQSPNLIDPNLRQVEHTPNNLVLRNTYFNNISGYISIYNRGFEAPIVIDETNFTGKEMRSSIDVKLNCSLKLTPENLPSLQKELARYGLGLKEERRKMQVMVLKAVF